VSDRVRLFFALALDDPLRSALADAVTEVERAAPRARRTHPDNLHLTLAFIGARQRDDVERYADILRAAASRTPALTLAIEGAGVFGQRAPRVLWAGVSGDVQTAAHLSDRLCRAADLEVERPYRPHITLARARGRGDPQLAIAAERLAGRSFGTLVAQQVSLYDSRATPQGLRYVPVATAEFAP
jgi:2'-5' RNA ligase